MKTRILNSEVLVAKDDFVKMSRADINSLKIKAGKNDRRRIRICAHKSIQDKFHEMIIVMSKGCYVRPHKHLKKTESLHIIEGIADAVFFDAKGEIVEVLPLGDFRSGRTMYYRLKKPIYHSLIVRSRTLIFHEATTGPFDRSKTILAPWAPKDLDHKRINEFMSKLNKEIKK